MADIEGDGRKRPPECNGGTTACPHMKCTYEGFDGERYRCDVCGTSFFLDYDDMK